MKFILSLLVLLLFALPLAGEYSSPVEVEPPITGITVERVEQQLAQLDGKEDAPARAALDLYREALGELRRAEQHEAQTLLYRSHLEETPERSTRLAELEQQLETARTPHPPLADDLTRETLSQRLEQRQADLATLRSRSLELEAELTRLRMRPDQSAQELNEAKQQLAATEAAMRTALGSGPVADARRTLQQAQRQERFSRVQRLELERLIHPQRMAELELRLNVPRQRQQHNETRIRQMQERLNELHAAQAAEAQQEAKRQLQQGEQHPLLLHELERNSDYSTRLRQLAEQVERATREREQIREKLQAVRSSRDRVSRQLEILGLEESLGELLRLEQRQLPHLGLLRRSAEELRQTLADTRIAAFRIDSTPPAPLPTLEQEPLRTLPSEAASALLELLTTTRDNQTALRNQLLQAYSRLERTLGEQLLEQQQLIDAVAQYQEFVDRNLVWIRGGSLLNLSALQRADLPLQWLLDPLNWQGSYPALRDALAQRAAPTLLLLLIGIASLLAIPQMRAAFVEWQAKIGKVHDDRYSFSLNGLLFVLLEACGPLLPLLYLAIVATTLQEVPALSAVGNGLFEALLVYLLLRILLGLLRPNGLARTHFRWNPEQVERLYRTLRWITPLLVITTLLVATLEWIPGEVERNALSRIAFIVTCLFVGSALHHLFHPQKGILATQTAPLIRLPHIRTLLHYLSLLLPLSLAILSLIGYHHGALKLGELLFYSLLILVATQLLHSMMLRKLMIAQRRLALQRARERRAAMLESRAKERDSSEELILEGLPVEESEQIDLETIDLQSRTMLNMLSGVLAIVALSWLWAELLPALGGLEEFVLWEYLSGGEQAELQVVTLWDVGLALAVLALTVIAANNLPGLLEITLLQPLEVKPGNRYAISLISRYLIITIGLVSFFTLVGLSWSELQWLVAAMGVGLGFGLKEIFANFFSGLIILFERQIRVGDWVTIDGMTGTVSRIRIRATTLVDWDNRELIIPNTTFLTQTLNNWTLSDSITRIVIRVGIAYGSDTEAALAMMKEVAASHPDVMSDPASSVLFIEFGDSSLNFDIRVYVEDRSRRMTVMHDLHMRLDKAFREAGVEIAFPQRDLHVRSIDPKVVELFSSSPPPAASGL